MPTKKRPPPRRAEADPETNAAHERLFEVLGRVELDLESLEIVERLVTKLASRSPIRRR